MQIFERLTEITIMSSVIIIVILAIRKIWDKKINDSIISLLWVLLVIRLVIPFQITLPFHIDNMFKQVDKQPVVSTYKADTTVTEVIPSVGENTELSIERNSIETGNNDLLKPEAQNQVVIEAQKVSIIKGVWSKIISVDIYIYALCVWMLGVVGLMIKRVIQVASFSKKIAYAKTDIHLSSKVDKIKAKLGIKKEIRIFETRYVNAPVTFGINIILLPMGYANQMADQKLSLILMHELAHIKRKDVLKNMVWMLICSVYWFNPLVLVAYKAYKEDIEYFCDKKVISSLSHKSKVAYLQSLIDVCKLKNSPMINDIPLALSVLENKTKIGKRVEDMLKPQRKVKYASIVSLLIVAVMVVGCFTTACLSNEEIETSKKVIETSAKVKIENKKVEKEPTEVKKEYKKLDYPVYDIAEYIENEDEGIFAEVNITKENIFIPEYVMPTVLIEEVEIPFETLKTLFKMLARDNLLYDSEVHQKVMTKEKLSQQKAMYQVELDASTQYGYKQSIRAYTKKIERIEDEMKTAPESYDSLPDDYFEKQFEQIVDNEKEDDPEFDEDDFRDRNTIRIPSLDPFILTKENYNTTNMDMVIGEKYFADRIWINSPDEYRDTYGFGYSMNSNSISTSISWRQADSLGLPYDIMADYELSEDNALNMAMEYVNVIDKDLIVTNKKALVYSDFIVDDDKYFPFGYEFTFEKTYEGVATKHLSPVNTDYLLHQKYNMHWFNTEKLIISVAKEGVLNIEYASPYKQKELLKEETALLSFEEIEKELLKNIMSDIIPREKYADTRYRYYDKAYLCLKEIYDVGSDEVVVKPIWIFTGGGLPIDREVTESKIEEFHEQERHYERVFLALNAETGSVIDLDFNVDLANMDDFEKLQ